MFGRCVFVVVVGVACGMFMGFAMLGARSALFDVLFGLGCCLHCVRDTMNCVAGCLLVWLMCKGCCFGGCCLVCCCGWVVLGVRLVPRLDDWWFACWCHP